MLPPPPGLQPQTALGDVGPPIAAATPSAATQVAPPPMPVVPKSVPAAEFARKPSRKTIEKMRKGREDDEKSRAQREY